MIKHLWKMANTSHLVVSPYFHYHVHFHILEMNANKHTRSHILFINPDKFPFSHTGSRKGKCCFLWKNGWRVSGHPGCSRMFVCVCCTYTVCVSLHCRSICPFYYCCLRSFWFISACSVYTTDFGWTLKLPNLPL